MMFFFLEGFNRSIKSHGMAVDMHELGVPTCELDLCKCWNKPLAYVAENSRLAVVPL